jgi:hypothetical protein
VPWALPESWGSWLLETKGSPDIFRRVERFIGSTESLMSFYRVVDGVWINALDMLKLLFQGRTTWFCRDRTPVRARSWSTCFIPSNTFVPFFRLNGAGLAQSV